MRIPGFSSVGHIATHDVLEVGQLGSAGRQQTGSHRDWPGGRAAETKAYPYLTGDV